MHDDDNQPVIPRILIPAPRRSTENPHHRIPRQPGPEDC